MGKTCPKPEEVGGRSTFVQNRFTRLGIGPSFVPRARTTLDAKLRPRGVEEFRLDRCSSKPERWEAESGNIPGDPPWDLGLRAHVSEPPTRVGPPDVPNRSELRGGGGGESA